MRETATYLSCSWPFCLPISSRTQTDRYTPDASGSFAGQSGYGYQSIAQFIKAAKEVSAGACTVKDVRAAGVLALADQTLAVTAILEAGRLSLDHGGAGVLIEYSDGGLTPVALRVEGLK
jgi:D-galacturonate reductase